MAASNVADEMKHHVQGATDYKAVDSQEADQTVRKEGDEYTLVLNMKVSSCPFWRYKDKTSGILRFVIDICYSKTKTALLIYYYHTFKCRIVGLHDASQLAGERQGKTNCLIFKWMVIILLSK